MSIQSLQASRLRECYLGRRLAATTQTRSAPRGARKALQPLQDTFDLDRHLCDCDYHAAVHGMQAHLVQQSTHFQGVQ